MQYIPEQLFLRLLFCGFFWFKNFIKKIYLNDLKKEIFNRLSKIIHFQISLIKPSATKQVKFFFFIEFKGLVNKQSFFSFPVVNLYLYCCF